MKFSLCAFLCVGVHTFCYGLSHAECGEERYIGVGVHVCSVCYLLGCFECVECVCYLLGCFEWVECVGSWACLGVTI